MSSVDVLIDILIFLGCENMSDYCLERGRGLQLLKQLETEILSQNSKNFNFLHNYKQEN